MFQIKFYNESGSVIFGGGKSTSPWRLTVAEGLALCGKTFTAARYAGQNGQETTAAVSNSRTITLAGDAYMDGDFSGEYASAIATLEKEGWLEINTDYASRRIMARCCEFRERERKGDYLLFTVQFICDNPYFEETVKAEVPVFGQIALLDKNFTFPGVFSKRIYRSSLFYEGSVETEPVFFINIGEAQDGENILTIKNHTSGEMLKLDYSAASGESITVDTKNRKIYNAKGDNLLKYLSDDSFFDGFHLYPGINDIEVINQNMDTEMSIMCNYSKMYAEAVLV